MAGWSVGQPGTPAWADTACLRVLAFSLQHPEGLGPGELTTQLALPSLWLMLITLQGWVEGSEAPGRGHVLSPDYCFLHLSLLIHQLRDLRRPLNRVRSLGV